MLIQKFKKELQEIQPLIIKQEFKSQPLIQSENILQDQLNPNQKWQFSQQLTFSTTYKHSSYSVTQKGKVIENNSADGFFYCGMCDQMIPKTGVIQFAVKIIQLFYIMIGIGFRDIVKNYKYESCFNVGGGYIDDINSSKKNIQYSKWWLMLQS
ncbi:unnamed protein product [Paramecium sonneborni]|uniref:Uncharacterized protein n=1 Tax=Paramecium sonneborni TaxID=65129 RepID=A0A8S1RW90_9CILI|nr:unnamed protein product [Paramecium sonneborni]